MKHLPNVITSLNLLSGCLAVILVMNGSLQTGCLLIFLAALLDFLDGLAARAVGVSSAFGKELDSLADVVSFGLGPGLILYQLMGPGLPAAYVALLIPLFSALRLARFNIDERQRTNFLGLPTPACGLFIACLPFIPGSLPAAEPLIREPYILVPLSIFLAFLLVAPLPLPSLKFSRDDSKGNRMRYIFLGLCLLCILLLKFAAAPVIMGLYLLSSLLLRKKTI